MTDDLQGITPAVLHMTVNPVDDPAIITGDFNATINEDGIATGDLNASDIEGRPTVPTSPFSPHPLRDLP